MSYKSIQLLVPCYSTETMMGSKRRRRRISRMIRPLYSFQTMNRNVFQGDDNQKKEVFGRLGGSSLGFWFGSSLALAAGWSCDSSSVTTSNSSSSFPYNL